MHPARVAFVVAGTDVPSTDPLGRLSLSRDGALAMSKSILAPRDRQPGAKRNQASGTEFSVAIALVRVCRHVQ